MLSMLLFLSGIISEKMLKRISKRFFPSAISLETKKLLIWASGLKTAKLMNLLLGDSKAKKSLFRKDRPKLPWLNKNKRRKRKKKLKK